MSILTSESLLPDCAGTSVDCNMNEPDGEKEVNMNNHQTKTTHADKSDLESADGEEQPVVNVAGLGRNQSERSIVSRDPR